MEKTKEEIGAIVFETKKHSIHKAVDGDYYICINKITGQQIVYYDLDWLINYASELNDGFELPDGYIHETHNYVVYRDDDEDNYVCMNKKDGKKTTASDSDFCISYAESKDAEFEKPKIEILYENYRTQVYRNPEGKYKCQSKENGSSTTFDNYDECVKYAEQYDINKPKTKGEILAEMLKQYENGDISEEEFINGTRKK